MGTVHSKKTVILLDGNDISTFTNSSDWDRNADEHDTTCYGMDDATYEGGLRRGSFPIGGVYDDTATGPKAVIEPLVGTKAELITRPEGTGPGKPESTVEVLVKSYKETAPVADMRQWSADLTMSGAVVTADQA
ncbi:hypothetical protein ALI144C_44835 [Actinosynnema sp. ALI-1.44]|uniref:hypothetical protein n=1 Tax=Actinosynnema sp. ALI-1.44 TaxID=1933779 RepID=UPI00097BFF3E|nr:hypothetical protein [Actinosynnema sp. ALI-1.44]ONI73080.1 hypothetical protein ALI144C_44835 [Actinosynnema sp. ALI-1.44]